MKNRKIIIILLAIFFVIQLIIPFLLISDKENIIKSGQEYSFTVTSMYAKNDHTLELYYIGPHNSSYDEYYKYALFTCDENGLCYIDSLSDTINEDNMYLKSASALNYELPIVEYKLKAENAEELDTIINDLRNNGRTFYSKVRILNGKSVIMGVYLDDGTLIDDLL